MIMSVLELPMTTILGLTMDLFFTIESVNDYIFVYLKDERQFSAAHILRKTLLQPSIQCRFVLDRLAAAETQPSRELVWVVIKLGNRLGNASPHVLLNFHPDPPARATPSPAKPRLPQPLPSWLSNHSDSMV
jgi:hypothetical protein